MKRKRIAIFVSGSGSNAEAVMQYFKHHDEIEIALLLTNNPKAYALERAKKLNVPTKVFDRNQFAESNEVLQWLSDFHVTHIVLAGFLWMIPKNLTDLFPSRIINIHPSLLPKFGGKGMYGIKVHEAVKNAGEKETGLTIHLVNEKYDDGEILKQVSCTISPSDTAEDISKKVLQLEHLHYPQVIEEWILKFS
jgi:phosphoribosylglycinamide formyltransferase-1